jgi:ABC-type branched-subunit amino acid transport system permease subunit
VRSAAWIIGAVFASMSGILLAPTLGLDATILTLLVVQAFGAAAVGRFSSLPLTYVGGLVIGVGSALASKYVADLPSLGGLPASLPFVLLFAVLLVTPRSRLADLSLRRRRVSKTVSLPRAAAIGGPVLAAAGLVLVPHVVGAKLPVFTNGVIYIVIFLSLGLLVRTSGQVSLCHAALAAVGASTFSHLTHGLGLPWMVALLLAGAATVPVGAIVAIPAIRLSGLYLALATFGFGVLLERMVYGMALMFGAVGRRPAPRPGIWGLDTDTGYYYVALAVAVAAALLVWGLRRGRLGRLLAGLADSPIALSHLAANVNVTRVVVFCISAFLAGIAGALLAGLTGATSGLGFSSTLSLLWLAILAISGRGEIQSALVAAAALAVVPAYLPSGWVDWQPVAFGVAAVIVALASAGTLDLSERFRRLAERSDGRSRTSPVRERAVADRAPAPELGAA